MNFETSEFVEIRRYELMTFLRKLLEHNCLKNTEELRSFLQDDEKVQKHKILFYKLFIRLFQ